MTKKHILKMKKRETGYMVDPIKCALVSAMGTGDGYDKDGVLRASVKLVEDTKDFYDEVTESGQLPVHRIVQFIYILDSLKYEFCQLVAVVETKLRIHYERASSIKDHLEIERAIKQLVGMSEAVISKQLYLEYGLELLSRYSREDSPHSAYTCPLSTLVANRFINEVIVTVVWLRGMCERLIVLFECSHAFGGKSQYPVSIYI